MIVPVTALIVATTNDATKLNCRAASAWGAVAAFQKPAQPPSVERRRTAASGIRTIRLR